MKYIDQAFNHPSYTHEMGLDRTESNQILEYLGDAVYELIIRKYLIERYPDRDEGWQTVKKNEFTNQAFQADLAKHYRLHDRLRLGKGEMKTGGKEKESILAQTLEALIGAIFLERGFDFTEEFLIKLLNGFIKAESPGK